MKIRPRYSSSPASGAWLAQSPDLWGNDLNQNKQICPSKGDLVPVPSSRALSSSNLSNTKVRTTRVRGPYVTRQKTSRVKGVARIHPRGFGFLHCEDGRAYFLPVNLAKYLLSGDVLYVKLAQPPRVGAEPVVERVFRIRRQGAVLMCQVREDSITGVKYLHSEEPCALSITLEGGLSAFRPGDVLGVQAPAYDGMVSRDPLRVTLKHNLGPRPTPMTLSFLTLYARVKYGFDGLDDGPSCEALGLAAAGDNRVDLKHLPFVTIDDVDTQDVDDALYAEALPEGGWRIMIAIADVSAFVKCGSELDLAARRRATSLYLPDGVYPMLPKAFSADQCSLLADKDRCAAVIDLTLSASGEVTSARITRAWIRSAAKLSYDSVTQFLEGQTGGFLLESGSQDRVDAVNRSVQALFQAYAALTNIRQTHGALELNEWEPVYRQNALGQWELKTEERTIAHRLVEQFMLLANQVAGQKLMERYGIGLFRQQLAPNQSAWEALAGWARMQGHELSETPSVKALAELLGSLPPEAHRIALGKIPSIMNPASYVFTQVGSSARHFSLGVENYTHFTSPLRRYADLVVHRLLFAEENYQLTSEDVTSLQELATHCTERSKAAQAAERFVMTALRLQGLMGQAADQIHSARVLKQTPRGVRVLLTAWQVCGWLLEDTLVQAGYAWQETGWVGLEDQQGQSGLEEGTHFSVNIVGLDDAQSPVPELIVKPAWVN